MLNIAAITTKLHCVSALYCSWSVLLKNRKGLPEKTFTKTSGNVNLLKIARRGNIEVVSLSAIHFQIPLWPVVHASSKLVRCPNLTSSTLSCLDMTICNFCAVLPYWKVSFFVVWMGLWTNFFLHRWLIQLRIHVVCSVQFEGKKAMSFQSMGG